MSRRPAHVHVLAVDHELGHRTSLGSPRPQFRLYPELLPRGPEQSQPSPGDVSRRPHPSLLLTSSDDDHELCACRFSLSIGLPLGCARPNHCDTSPVWRVALFSNGSLEPCIRASTLPPSLLAASAAALVAAVAWHLPELAQAQRSPLIGGESGGFKIQYEPGRRCACNVCKLVCRQIRHRSHGAASCAAPDAASAADSRHQRRRSTVSASQLIPAPSRAAR